MLLPLDRPRRESLQTATGTQRLLLKIHAIHLRREIASQMPNSTRGMLFSERMAPIVVHLCGRKSTTVSVSARSL
jgi:hypothetical protein